MAAQFSYLTFDRKPGSNEWLDLIRAVAISLVLMRHGERAVAALGRSEPNETLRSTLFLNGWIGVDLFFVLSGYLITRHLVRNGIGTGNFGIGRYLAMRALRIVPAYVAVVFLVIASVFPFYAFPHENMGHRVLYHLLFLQDYLPSDINVVFWSLGVEEKFYLLAPILIWVALRQSSVQRSLALILVVSCISPILRMVTYLELPAPVSYEVFFRTLRSPFHASLEPLLAGTVIALAERSGLLRGLGTRNPWPLVWSILVLVVWLASHEFLGTITMTDAVLQPIINAAVCGFVVLGAVAICDRPAPGELAGRIMARLSYALYLVHFPLLPLALALAYQKEYALAIFWATYLSAAFVFALAVHFGVEKPFLQIKDRLSRQQSRRDRAERVGAGLADGLR